MESGFHVFSQAASQVPYLLVQSLEAQDAGLHTVHMQIAVITLARYARVARDSRVSL